MLLDEKHTLSKSQPWGYAEEAAAVIASIDDDREHLHKSLAERLEKAKQRVDDALIKGGSV